MQRRKYIAAAGTTIGALLAGCLNNGEDSTPDNNQTDTGNSSDNNANTDTPNTNSEEFAGPVALTEAVIEAASQGDVERFTNLLHPLNPVSDVPTNELNLGRLPATESTIALETQGPSVETVYKTISTAERRLSGQEDRLQEALQDNAGIVSVTLPDTSQAPRGNRNLLWVVAPNEDDQLRLLFQGFPVGIADLPGVSTQVVDDVVFDTEASIARLKLPSEPPEGELSVRTGTTRDSFEIGPRQQKTPTIPIGDGGELAIDFQRENEVVVLHRELYGDQRVVDGITIKQKEQLENNRAQVEFTNKIDAHEITLTSTRLEATTTASGGQTSEKDSDSIVSNINTLNTTVAPEYDELIVGISNDGDKSEVHRERLYYDQ